MGEVTSRFKEEFNAVKLLAFFGIFFMIFDAISLFYASADPNGLYILYGIIEIILAAVVFLSLEFVDLGKVKIPFQWWILLVVGVVLIIFGFLTYPDSRFTIFGGLLLLGDLPLFVMSYFSAILIIMAALIELLAEKQGWKASKMMVFLGGAFGVYDCILLFGGYIDIENKIWLANGIFGIILLAVLLLTMQPWIDIKVPYVWWILMAVGFVFLIWVSPMASGIAAFEEYPLGGFGGIVLLIGMFLLLLGF
ncbi:MAG: hypothetical protein HWN81_08140 [Candidatus Lokiarchaeota archaeon]|nr:hypothetical protein [Candidatus Lokiarchaeota archaeon]